MQLNCPLLNVFFCYFVLWINFCEITYSTHQFEVFFLLFCLWVASGFLLVSSDFKLWQQKLTLACVLHLSHGAKVLRFLTTHRQTFKYYFLLRSVCTGELWHFSPVSNALLLKWQYMLDTECTRQHLPLLVQGHILCRVTFYAGSHFNALFSWLYYQSIVLFE